MGMPVIEPSTTTREQAITDLIQSVALQEAALAHIMNAEGEKLQAVIAIADVTVPQLLAVNRSVERMVSAISRLETTLQAKLDIFADELLEEEIDVFA
ncbi:MAG: hypothetical protein FWG90_01340 [Oscillospiraceae bacterium]|nr:hypothetical protein [Oscillospiraceae bacterium]